MEIPKLKEKNRNLTEYYSIKVTPEVKNKLEELKTFHGVDVPEWIRQMIQKGLSTYSERGKNPTLS